jgi:phosphosulfolactate phosphohydrolase-like enzyme
MWSGRRFKIDAFAESAYRSLEYDAIVCIDVMLAATTAVTCLARGGRIFFARTPEEAHAQAAVLEDPILAHEDSGKGHNGDLRGFELSAGPASLGDHDRRRPLVLVSALADLLANANGTAAVYVACLRNLSAMIRHLCVRHERVALISTGYAGELRCEDQLVAGWIGRALRKSGFEIEDMNTRLEVERWGEADPSVIALGKAADYLRRLGQNRELEFVLAHVDDLPVVGRYVAGELKVAGLPSRPAPVPSLGPARPAQVVSTRRRAADDSRAAEARLPDVTLEPTA